MIIKTNYFNLNLITIQSIILIILLHALENNHKINSNMKSINQNTAVIILAGGKSQRAETIKGLRLINDEYWIDIQICFFKKQGFKNIFVGLGYDNQEYISKSKELSSYKHAINPKPQNGSFSTLQNTLIAALKSDWNHSLLIHIDHALPKATTIEKLLENNKYEVNKPNYNNKSGHPIVMSRAFCETLIQKSNSAQLNTEIQKLRLEQILWVEVDDKNIHSNFNTIEKWQAYKRELTKS